jgi:MFS family permease
VAPEVEPRSQITGDRTTRARDVAGLFLVYASIYIPLAAVAVIYLPTRVAELAPADKVGMLALVTTASSLLVMVGQPVIGALSDRTSGRLGRRVPWMLAGAFAALVLVPLLGVAGGVLMLAIVWAACELALNTVQAPTSAAAVDRIPPRRRGLVAGAIGAGFLVGSAVGASVIGPLMLTTGVALWIAALTPVAGVVVFMIATPDAPSGRMPRLVRGWRVRLAGALVDPRRNPDFAWTLLSRMLVTLAHASLVTFLLYIAQDHLGLSPVQAAALAGLVVIVILAASFPTLILGGWLSDRTERRRAVVVAAALLMAASLLIPLFSPTVPAILVFAGVFGLGYGAYNAASKALGTLVLSDETRSAGKELGVLNIASTLPQVMAPGVAWLVVTLTGGYTALFALGLVLVMLGGLAILRVRSVR